MLKAFVIGNLGADAEIRNENGSQFVTFKVAHNERFRDKEGNTHEESVWVSCVMNGRNDNLVKYLIKGTTVAVIGDLRLKTYHSAKMHRLVAGADLFVRSIDLVGSRPDSVPSRLYDTDGTAHSVTKLFYCDTAKGQSLMTAAGLQFWCNPNGWVTPLGSQIPPTDAIQEDDTVSSDMSDIEQGNALNDGNLFKNADE